MNNVWHYKKTFSSFKHPSQKKKTFFSKIQANLKVTGIFPSPLLSLFLVIKFFIRRNLIIKKITKINLLSRKKKKNFGFTKKKIGDILIHGAKNCYNNNNNK